MNSAPSSRPRRFWLWAALSLPVLVVVLLLIGTAWVRSYLRGEDFRRFLSAKVSQGIRADGTFEQLDWTGSTFYSPGFSAQGWVGTKFQMLDASQVRAAVNLHGLWEHKWQVDSIEIEKLRVIAGEGTVAREKIESSAPKSPTTPAKQRPGWLPNQVELGKVTIADLGIDASGTKFPVALDGVNVTAAPDGQAWNISSSGGHLHRAGWPDLDLAETKLRYNQGTLFVTDAGLGTASGGTLKASGQVSFDQPSATDVTLQLDALPVETVLPEDWKARLHGKLSGQIHVTHGAKYLISEGHLELKDGHLEALPVLDQIAAFTRTERFRQLTLENVHGDVRQEGKLTEVKNFNAESPGLIRLTGNFTIKKERIDGEFLVGVTPGSLRYIPGSQEKVFTLDQDGYLWTTMKVTGPLSAPREDLSKRLASAAGQAILDQIQQDPSKLKDTLKDAAQSLLDLLGK